MKRYSVLVLVTLALAVTMAFGSTALAGDKCCAKDGSALNTPRCEKAGAKVCPDKAQCTKACQVKDCKDKGQCFEACKAACTNKQGVACKPGECKPSDCKGAPSK